MEQVFRIEIPVEAVDKTDTAALQQLESTLQKLFTAMKQNKATAGEVFDALERSASEAKASVKQVETATEQAASSYEQAGAAAADAGDQQKQAASGAENATEKLEDSVSEVSDAYGETASAAADAGRKSGTAFNSASTSADKFTQRVEKSQKTLRQMFKEKMQLVIAAIDRASPVLKTIWNSAKGLAGKTWHVAVRMKDFITAPFRKLWNLVNNPITMALSVAGFGLSANEVLQTFNEFETGMSAVKSLTGATDEEFLSLKQTAKDLGASTSFSASEASQGMQYLAMAGWDTSQIIAAMPGLLDLAAAGATDLGIAADIVSDVMTAMGMSADQASRAADIFAKTATSSNTTIEGLGETLKYAAPIAHSFGLSLEEVSAIAGMMGNAGIKGSMAGTAIRSSLMSMAAPTAEASKLMKQLGVSFSNADGSMKDMKTIVRDLQNSFSGLTESEKLAYTETLFGTYASSAWLGVIDQGADVFDNFQASLEGSTGAAKEMAAIRLDNLAGDMEELGGALETAKLELMEKIDPYLRKGVQWLTNKIPEIQAKLESTIDRVIEKVSAIKEHLNGVFESDAFKNADGFAEKFFIAWDKIIAEPFAKWWENGGQETILGAVSRVGENIGKLLHGIIAGIFAALKGEEIDFEGLNLTGVAKAGAEAAKSFVSSFMASFDLGGLASEMPGAMKAGLFGFGAIKIGQGGLGIYRTVTALKTAFSGVTGAATTATAATAAVGKTAATSAVGIAKAGTVLGGLKTALAAIPVWGWVAAAAITALAVGVKLYTDEQARRKQQILDLESTVEGHIATYRREAEEINAITGTVETIREIKINATYEGPGPQEYMDLKTELAMLGSRENQLNFLINTGLNPEKTIEDVKAVQAALVELGYDLGNTGADGNGVDGIWGDKTQSAFETQMQAWKSELEGIQTTSAATQAELDTMKSDIQSLVDTVTELNALENPEITITATLNKWGIEDEADIELIKSLASEITTKTGLLMQGLLKYGMSYEDFEELVGLSDSVSSKSGEFSETLAKYGLTDTEWAALVALESDVKTAQGVFSEELAWYGLTQTEWTTLTGLSSTVSSKYGTYSETLSRYGLTVAEFEDLCQLGNIVGTDSGYFSETLSRYGLTVEEFNTLTGLKSDVDSAYGVFSETLWRFGMTVADFEYLQGLEADVKTKSGTFSETLSRYGMTVTDFEALVALEADVKTSNGVLSERLAKYGMTIEEFNTLTGLYSDVQTANGTLSETLAKYGLGTEEFKTVCALADSVQTKEGILTITTKLQGYGLTILGISSLQSLVKNNELLEQKVRITLDKETSLTPEQIDEYVTTLKGNKTREIEIELQLDGAAMTYQQIAAINSELQTIKQRKVELDVVVGEGTATAEQIEEYTQLLSREAAIELMLTGVNLTPEEIGALTEEWDGLKTIDSEIYVHMSEAGLDETEVDLLKQHIDGIGDATAIITVALSNTSPEAAEQQKAALMEQYERLSGELESSFGIQLSAEQLASGQFDSLIYGMNGEWRENMQRADWYTLKTANEEETQGVVEPAQQLISDNQQRIAELQSQASAQSEAVAPAVNMLSLIESLGAEYDSRVRTARDDPEAFNEWREGTYNPALFEAYKAYVHSSPETSWVGDDQISEMWSGFLNNGADTPMHETLLGMFGGWDSIFGEQPNVAQQDVAEVEAMNAEIARLQAEIDTANAGLAAAYGEEKDIATSEAFIGSDYFGKPIEEIAANYATLDEAAQGMFLQALSALETLNTQTDYIADGDKTSASEMLDLAAKSEIMASIQAQVDGISLKYGEMSNEDLLKLDGLEEGKTTLEAINGALDALGLDKIESMTQIKDALESIAGVDMSKFSVDAAATAIQSLTGDANSGKTSVDALRTALANLDGKTATTTINEYTNKITTYKTNGSPAQNAAGGIYDGAFLSWVAEDGPEAIIPLGSKRRGRGIDLWLQAGEMLGVSEFADGGIMAPYTGALEDLPADYFDDDDGDGSPKPIRTGSEGGHGGNSFSISVSANPTFQITGGDSEDILDKLKGKQKELAELFGGALAEQLEDIVANMV